MGYLDNSSITVDAVLTKKGREILKNGGNLNITNFTLSDTGVDYTLWNSDHPSGSAFYGEAIENLPQLEASVHAEYNLRNRLLTLNQDTVSVSALVLNGLDSKGGVTLTFGESDNNRTAATTIFTKLVGYTPSMNVGKYLVVQDPTLVTVGGANPGSIVSGTGRMFLHEQDIPHARQYNFAGNQFTLEAKQQDVAGRSTNIYVVDVETGAYNSFTVTINITKNTRALLSSGGVGA